MGMKVLLLESARFRHAFQALGHQTLCIGPHPDCDVQVQSACFHRQLLALLAERGFEPDLCLWCDQGYPPVLLGFEALPCPVIALTIDDYCNPWHIPFSAAFDLVLVAQKDYVPLFARENLPREARWSPLFCDASKDQDPGRERDLPAVFVGTLSPRNIPERLPFLKAFQRRAPLVLLQGEYAPLFQRARIVLNQTAVGELNFRIFEAAACGAAVLTEDAANGLADIFTAGETILPPYPRGDAAAAAATARHWLDRPGDLARVAAAGRDLVLSRHTLQHRAVAILEDARRLRDDEQPAWRMAQRRRVHTGMATAFAFLAAELTDPASERMRKTYLNLAQGYPQLWASL